MVMRRKADWIEWGKGFDIEFWQYYIDSMNNATKLKVKRKEKLVLLPRLKEL